MRPGQRGVLAWLLRPADFGKVGLARTVSSAASTLISFEIGDALLQRQRRLRFWVTPTCWTSLLLGAAGAALVVTSPLVAVAYDGPDVAPLIWIHVAPIRIASVSSVPTVMICAALDMGFILLNAADTVATQGLRILLAGLGAGAYNLFIPLVFLAAIRAVVCWRRARPRLRGRRLRPRQIKHILTGNGLLTVSSLTGLR